MFLIGKYLAYIFGKGGPLHPSLPTGGSRGHKGANAPAAAEVGENFTFPVIKQNLNFFFGGGEVFQWLRNA